MAFALVALALVALVALFGRDLLERGEQLLAREQATPAPPPRPIDAPHPTPPGAPEPAAEPAPEPAEPLPPLGESDAFVRERAAAASARPELAAWLAGEGLVRRYVAAVDNVANGESPRAHLPELRPKGPFQATARDGRHFVTQRSSARYDLVASVFGSLDAGVCARLHRLLLPLFEEAYGELGRREGGFDDLLARAFRELLQAPVVDAEVEVVPKIRSYRFADPGLEALSPAQKHLLRMGSRNARLVQAKLRELATALELELEQATGSGPAN